MLISTLILTNFNPYLQVLKTSKNVYVSHTLANHSYTPCYIKIQNNEVDFSQKGVVYEVTLWLQGFEGSHISINNVSFYIPLRYQYHSILKILLYHIFILAIWYRFFVNRISSILKSIINCFDRVENAITEKIFHFVICHHNVFRIMFKGIWNGSKVICKSNPHHTWQINYFFWRCKMTQLLHL